ncbi:hypothetical protein V6N12_076133 [Hibiscus sabdariffa]|uniref:Uncharacterized protein n=1 Tax=Hibiscus sabdariffa TaxID=183260 RepID=A0ABR2AYC4_9ROSI
MVCGLYPYWVNLLTLKTGYRLERWTDASSSLCKKRSKVGVHTRQDPRSEPSVKELIALSRRFRIHMGKSR